MDDGRWGEIVKTLRDLADSAQDVADKIEGVGGGEFIGAEDVAIPAPASDLFTAIPAAEFRHDLSSTQLRERMAQ